MCSQSEFGDWWPWEVFCSNSCSAVVCCWSLLKWGNIHSDRFERRNRSDWMNSLLRKGAFFSRLVRSSSVLHSWLSTSATSFLHMSINKVCYLNSCFNLSSVAWLRDADLSCVGNFLHDSKYARAWKCILFWDHRSNVSRFLPFSPLPLSSPQKKIDAQFIVFTDCGSGGSHLRFAQHCIIWYVVYFEI